MPEQIQKLLLDRKGFQLHFGFDFQKATDETQRTVVGFATLDNLDQTGDIVLAKASEEAFRAFRGNIREQHNKANAVGRMIAFEPAEYIDPQNHKVYKGIRVAVRISEGAEDTWKKCQDGTYSGFSIGGAVLDSEDVFNKELGRTVKVITKYRLTELSLVDNPANELANFETVYKAIDGADLIEKDFSIKNLFWCPKHSIGAKSQHDTYTCATCGENMAKIGTIGENENIQEKLDKILTEFEINTEGVIPTVAKEIEKNADGVEEVTDAENKTSEVKAEAAAETAAETKTEEKSETGAETLTLAALREELDKVRAVFESKTAELVTAKVNELKDSVEAELKKLADANTDLTKKIDSKDELINELKKSLESTGERVEKIAGETAMQKSEDVVREVEKSSDSQDDGWDSIFSGKYNLTS